MRREARTVSKYKAIKTEVDGVAFHSRKEANRYRELKLLEKCGKISELGLQPRWPIFINNMLICYYIADFRYYESGEWIIEDVKGMKTPIYNLKKKLIKAI